MAGVAFEVDLSGFYRSLSSIERNQVPFAAALALNDTAKDVDDAWGMELEEKLDRPTPFTKRGKYVRRATKSRPVAEIGFKSIQSAYLKLQIEGGIRVPAGRAILVPGKMRLNKYGNMPRGAVGKALAMPDTFIASDGAARTAHLAPGIYKRPAYGAYRRGGKGNKNRGSQVGPELLVSFKDRADYAKRLQLLRVAEKAVVSGFADHFRRRFGQAMATAR